MSLGLPEITTSPPSYHIGASPVSGLLPSPASGIPSSSAGYFRGIRIVLQNGALDQRLRHSFVLHAKLGDSILRTGLLQTKVDHTFNVDYAMTFPYSGEQALSLFARLDGVPLTSKLAMGIFTLRGATPDRSRITTGLQLVGPKGDLWGLVNVTIELTDLDLELRSTPLADDQASLSRQPTLRPTPSMPYVPTPSDRKPMLGLFSQASDTSRMKSWLREPQSSRRSMVSNAPSQYDKIATPSPYRGVKLVVYHGAGWHNQVGKDLQFVVACGARGIASKEPVHVLSSGDFSVNQIFQHEFANDRLLHLAVRASKTDLVGQSICDTLYLMECGVVTCKQHLSFYNRFGILEGHVEVVTEFLMDTPPPGVFSFDPSTMSPRKSTRGFRSDLTSHDLANLSPTTGASPSDIASRDTKLQMPLPLDTKLVEEHDVSVSTHSRTPPPSTPKLGAGDDTPLSLALIPQGSAAVNAYKAEQLSFHTPNRSLLCAVWSIRDLPTGSISCSTTMAIGQFVAAGQGLLPVTDQCEARIRKVFSLPYANQRFVELRVLVDCGTAQCMRGSTWINLEGLAMHGQTGMTEVEVRTVTDNEYMGVVGIWLELSRREYPLGTKVFPSSERWGNSILPPSSLLVIAQGEEFGFETVAPGSPASSPRSHVGHFSMDRRTHHHARAPTLRQATTPPLSSALVRMCSSSPRMRPSSPMAMCGSPRTSLARTPSVSDRMIQSKHIRTRYARSLPPVDSSILKDTLAAPLDRVQSIDFRICGLRNLPDSYRCQSMKLIFLVKGKEIICSQGIRINSLNPDFTIPISLSVPFCRQDTLQIDILEISVPLKPITLGRVNWNISETLQQANDNNQQTSPAHKQASTSLRSEEAPTTHKGITKVLPHSHDGDHFYDRPSKDIFCLYSATFSKEPSTNSFYLPDLLTSTPDESLEWQPDELVVHRRHRQSYVAVPPDLPSPSSVSPTSVCVTVGEIEGLVIPSLPFEKQTLMLILNVAGRHLKSNKVTVEKLRRVHLDTRFFVPIPPDSALDLHFQILSMTPVTPITVAAEGVLQLRDLWKSGDADWAVRMACRGSKEEAHMAVQTELIGRPTRVPLIAQMSSPTSVRGGRFMI